MEEAISEGQCNKYLSEEPDFMSQLLGNFSIPVQHEVPTDNTNNNMNCSNLDSNLSFGDGTLMYYYYASDDNIDVTSMHSSSHFYPPSHHFLMANDHNFTGMVDYGTVDANNDAIQVDEFLSRDVSNDSFQGTSDLELGKRVQKTIGESLEEERSKKRPMITPDVQRSKKLKSCPKIDVEKNKTNINIINGASCSEDYSNEISGVPSASRSKKSEPLHLTGKTRASKGTATDPQSLYARKRRERINERLRVLQNLVPNGTKVDISTMLEEAVQYVKFLQLQIKLLRSDDMWMYAPIAYNGMNLGLDLIISTPRSQP